MSGFKIDTWEQVHCPACGELPTLNLLKGDPARHFSFCSSCDCQWPTDRFSCSVCGEKKKGERSYFHGEGQDNCQIVTCDSCHHFIKTIDLTKTGAIDPCLEDLASAHLDVVAEKKGYTRTTPNPWSE